MVQTAFLLILHHIIRPMKSFYIETYGCQMNFADSEIVASVLCEHDYQAVDAAAKADVILINTCSIRDNAEQRVVARVRELQALRKNNPNLRLGVIGCMAERLKEKLFVELQGVQLLAGPDSYRSLPELLAEVESSGKAMNVMLSENETYEDIAPVRLDSNGVSAFIAIIRGCNNFCSYCVVPYTRGRERSRPSDTIVEEARQLFEQGFREITLLGQNVNSYADARGLDFPSLLRLVAAISPLIRVRFATSHPKDLSDNLIDALAEIPNICKSIHLPVQSGSNSVLHRMNRKYTRESYLERLHLLKKRIPDITVSTDIIAGFCGETEEEHSDTLKLMKDAGFYYAFMFKYSEREGTFAANKLPDDVPEGVKTNRLNEIIGLQQQLSLESYRADVGKIYEVLVEGVSKRSENQVFGRTSGNKVVVFDGDISLKGSYVMVEIQRCTAATLIGSRI